MSPPVDPADNVLSPAELEDAWPVLSTEERVEGFRLLDGTDADDFFLALSSRDQAELVSALSPAEARRWVRILPPDDAADLVQHLDPDERGGVLALMDAITLREVAALLAYEEDEAGGLMSPRFARLRPDMTVDEAISYLRRQARRRIETIYYVYVLDAEQRLLGVVSFRELFASAPGVAIRDVMHTDLWTVPERMDQESVAHLLAESDLLAMPVVDEDGRMMGIVTVDDIVDVVREEATEDIHKGGGMAALDAPYLEVPFWEMVRKRGGWLVVLFLGELLTATAMAHFEEAIARAVVLATFVPLLISSGGNSGSQAATLVIRAMALDEVRLRDWWRVLRRELATGLTLGLLLASIGVARVLGWEAVSGVYGEQAGGIAATVGISLLGIVLLGTVTGSTLPLLLRRVGFDPASASAPFVATLVDVTGVILYFSVASWIIFG